MTESQLRRNSTKDHHVELRKLAKSYIQFIKGSQKFYRQFILSLDTQYNGIPELRKIAQKWKDVEASKTSLRTRIPTDLKTQVLQSCHQTLIYLGDLSRYRETETVDKDRNWGPAKGYYELAAEIYPDDGQSHNQLAILSREDGNHFRTVYHLYRALAVNNRHPQAKANLEHEFKRIVRAWDKGELINNHRAPDGSTAGRALVAWFVRLHSKCYKGEEFAQYDELENEVTGQLAVELKERSLDSILNKVILINMAAEYFATVQMIAEAPPANITRTYFYYLRLNVKTFFTLLQVLQPELERLSEGDDVTLQNGDKAPQLSDKLTAVARRVLPGLRLYSTWFARNWHILDANLADTLTTVEVQELWKAYAETLSLLVSSFPVDQLPNDNYMLEEDTDTIGFQPLISDNSKRLWYNDDGTFKRKWSDMERNHPNIEMLMRVKDLLIDGLILTQNAKAPLDLDNLRFIYREAGLPSELLASPGNRADGSPAGSAVPIELPLVPQDGPLPEDQKSFSVAAPSESASTTLAKDSAMNRMVDDLVGADEGLDPLVEEDETVSPTPPAQTFEDTADVSDGTFAPAPLLITDFVKNVTNYKRSAASPSPAAVSFSTPMNRVASSSSIRQPAHLPSLPDGHGNANNIWNPSYTGTPGPSSPMLGNGVENRGSPMMGMRMSSVSGHMRGDSAHSLRSVENTMPSAAHASPIMSSPTWGNAGTSPYTSFYGNGFNHSQNGNGYAYNQNGNHLHQGNGSDYNLISQNLFPSSVYNGLDSSYGRTPPNGQAG
ncbi:hypothetical protein BS50DRAFT_25515 [Corynespora cassiicola Philippines]|uniref:DNA/RNA-binding domain-containing protein n=1 Tax=Corynespora cassiicola Philippines TaxID=1448308 RepID=A0A2T2PB02_CORCC|nr:hypothetical protein BS50DRAFT_25515 [Corynespora cassiicola Philippines]